MKHFANLSLLLTVLLGLHSCAAIKRTSYHENVATTAIIQAPLISDLEVDVTKKVSATYRAFKSNEADAKQGALHEAMKQSGCDVIVHPVYETKFYPKVIEVTVNGICAKYKTVRKPNLDDVEMMHEMVETRPLFDPAALAALTAPSAPSLGQNILNPGPKVNPRLGEDWKAYRKVRNSGLALLISGIICLPVGTTNTALGFVDYSDTEDEGALAQGIVGTLLTIYGVIGISAGVRKLKKARSLKPQPAGGSLSLISHPVNGHQTFGLAMKF